MSEKQKTNLLTYGITAAVCLVLAGGYLVSQNWETATLRDIYRYLCDGCFLPGVLCLFSGLMVWLANEGSFDGVGYVVTHTIKMLIPGAANKHETYKEYLERVHGKKPAKFGFMIVVGLAFIVLAMVFYALYYQQYS